MPIDTVHEEYAAMADRWARCRDTAEGLDGVRRKKGQYLPMLSEQSDPEYRAYLLRADYYPAMGRSIQGHSGSVWRKDPKVVVPEAAEEWLDDITLTGVDLSGLMLEAYRELLAVGRYGIYVEMPPKGEDGQTKGRPFIVLVPAENIISWRTESRNGRRVLNRVILKEIKEEEDPEDPFVLKRIDQYRVLQMDDMSYTQAVYRKADGSEDFTLFEGPTSPDKRGKEFDFIPFWFGNATNITPGVEKPPLMEVADLTLSMFRNSADLENGFHFVGSPTPWVAGFPQSTVLKIGSNQAWVTDKSDAKAGMLEFTGQGLNGLSEHIMTKKRDCAQFGSKLLEEQKKGSETAETVRLRHAGETASLISMVETVDKTFTEALNFALMWAGISGEAIVSLNRDLLAVKAKPEELTALTAAVQSGLMSYETYYYNLEQLEVTRPDVDADDELQAIEDDANREVVLKVETGRGATEDEDARATQLAEDADAAAA